MQETHSTENVEINWSNGTRGELLFSHGSSNSRGAAILFGNQLEYKIIEKIADNNGRFIIVLCIIQDTHFLLINTYSPNDENSQVETVNEIFLKVNELEIPLDTFIIWGGDFNITFDLKLEAFGGNPTLKVKTIQIIKELLTEMNLCDIWRIRNPCAKR